jgi:hypothetical protein
MKATTQLERPPTPEKMGRSSFSSVREHDDNGVAQTFTSTKVSSYAAGTGSEEVAVDDSSCVDVNMADVEFVPPITQPFSRLHGSWYPANSFRGWKQINVQGKTKTRSFGDLHVLNMMWTAPPKPPRGKQAYPPGGSPRSRTGRVGKLPAGEPGRVTNRKDRKVLKGARPGGPAGVPDK